MPESAGEISQSAVSGAASHNATRKSLANTSNSYPRPLPRHGHSIPYPTLYNYPYPYMTPYMAPYPYHPAGPHDYPPVPYPVLGAPVQPPPVTSMWNAHYFAHPAPPAGYFPTVAPMHSNTSAAVVGPLRLPRVEPKSRHALEERKIRDERHKHVALFYDKLHSILPTFLEAVDPFHLDKDGQWKSDYSVVFRAPLPALLEYYYWPAFKEMMDRDVHPDVIKDELKTGPGRKKMLRAIQEWRDGLEEMLAWVVAVG